MEDKLCPVGQLFETLEGVNNTMEKFFRRGAIKIEVQRVTRDDGLRFELTAWFETYVYFLDFEINKIYNKGIN